MPNQDSPHQEQVNWPEQEFLPNLCSVQSVFFLVLLSSLLSLVFAVIEGQLFPLPWLRFAEYSLFILWTALIGAGVLCQLRPWLRRWPTPMAASVSYGVSLLTAAGVGVAGQLLFSLQKDAFGYTAFDWPLLAKQCLIAAVLAGIGLRYIYLQQQLQNQQRAQLNAQIQALQARIRPHFLFNSMNIIASLIHVDPDLAEQVVEELADLFRASLAEASMTTVERELSLCRHYMHIEQLRMGDRLQVQWQIELEDSSLQIPSLILQPLLENAVYHGVQPDPDGGQVVLTVKQTQHALLLDVFNTLPAGYALGQQRHKAGNHMAQNNILQRLRAHYGGSAMFSAEVESGGYRATIQIDHVVSESR